MGDRDLGLGMDGLTMDGLTMDGLLDGFLLLSLGFLGSFGHCASMCGPLAVMLAIRPRESGEVASGASGIRWWEHPLVFHGLLNLGRVLSYAVVGGLIGAVGSVLVSGGQGAGVGSELRRGMAIASGGLLVWWGVAQVAPGLMPSLPMVGLLGKVHGWLMGRLGGWTTTRRGWVLPLGAGLVWGLIPCGFLYAAQIRVAATGDAWLGAGLMVAFGLGTVPSMLGVGVLAARWSRDRRDQLFRLGGWITLGTGLLLVSRSGTTHADYSGYAALGLLMAALVARPLVRVWPALLIYRRGLGVGAFGLALVHALNRIDHNWQWNWAALDFQPLQYRWAIYGGLGALGLLTPLAFTSFDQAQRLLGRGWRRLHLLGMPALILGGLHALLISDQLLGGLPFGGLQRGGGLQASWGNWLASALLVGLMLGVLGVRRWPPRGQPCPDKPQERNAGIETS